MQYGQACIAVCSLLICTRVESVHGIYTTTEKQLLTYEQTVMHTMGAFMNTHASMQHFLTRQILAVAEGSAACVTPVEMAEEVIIAIEIL